AEGGQEAHEDGRSRGSAAERLHRGALRRRRICRKEVGPPVRVNSMRRATFRDQTVDYAAVGASQAADLLQYPPEKSLPAVDSWRIGSGEERFRKAAEDLLSWRVITGAGLELTDVRPSSGAGYTG